MDTVHRRVSPVRAVVAAAILTVGLFLSACTALLIGMYLYEGESGLDRLASPYSLWQLAVSALFGAAGIAGFRMALRRRVFSRWLLAALVLPAAGAAYLASIPAEYAPQLLIGGAVAHTKAHL